jgi:hypothetical protein
MNFAFKHQLLTAMMAIAIMASGVASAADAIDIKNVADPVRHPYQQTASQDCATGGTCLLVFPAITTGRTLVLHASCQMTIVDSNFVA